MKGERMWSKLAIGTLFIGIILLGYHVLGGVLGLGYSDQVKFAPQSPIGFLGPERFEWINSLPNELLQKVALFIAQTPLYALIFGISLLFFLIHFIVPDKN
jgi:glycerol uptake facilitator-like aquaporin